MKLNTPYDVHLDKKFSPYICDIQGKFIIQGHEWEAKLLGEIVKRINSYEIFKKLLEEVLEEGDENVELSDKIKKTLKDYG